jgi:hypothetical protein
MKVNWLAILVALVAQQAFGFLWYSRPLFADSWAAGIGRRAEDLAPSIGMFLLAMLAALLLAVGIAWVLYRAHLRGVRAGAVIGFGVGAFFVAPAVVVHEAFIGLPGLVLAIDGTKEILSAMIVGAILGGWPRRAAA